MLFQPTARQSTGQADLYETPESDESARRLLAEEADRSFYYRGIADRVDSEIPKRGRLLEIGCGAGGLSAELVRRGYEVEGIEPSPRLRDAAEKRLGDSVPLHSLRLEEAAAVAWKAPYDAVLAVDVVEHLADPLFLPRLVRPWLATGGRLFLQTPNAGGIRRYLQRERWEQLAPEEHLHLHTVGSLTRVLTAADYSDLRVRTLSGTGTDGHFRRSIMRPIGGILAGVGWGNGIWASARKDES